METDNTFQDQTGLPHVLVGTVAFLALALLGPILRVIQLMVGV
ncbi:hypothetical protein [Aliidiomarina quisquiliarum]|nr:hypothetical protein [Aliidiomarina quisquiliarum]